MCEIKALFFTKYYSAYKKTFEMLIDQKKKKLKIFFYSQIYLCGMLCASGKFKWAFFEVFSGGYSKGLFRVSAVKFVLSFCN